MEETDDEYQRLECFMRTLVERLLRELGECGTHVEFESVWRLCDHFESFLEDA